MAKRRNRFVVVPSVNRPRSRFPLNYSNKMTFNSGKLIPVGCLEVVAGDTIDLKLNNITRMLVPAVPVMDNCILDIFHFWVPFRLCTKHVDDWQKIHGENVESYWANETEYTLANTGNTYSGIVLDDDENQINGFSNGEVIVNSCASYLGYPKGRIYTQSNIHLNTLPLRAYLRIWNEYFRDENLQAPLEFDGSDSSFIVDVAGQDFLSVAKLHDRYTSCLPAPQKGNAISIFAGTGIIPVTASSTAMHSLGAKLTLSDNSTYSGTSHGNLYSQNLSSKDSSNNFVPGNVGISSATSGTSSLAKNITHTNLQVNLSDGEASTINELRIRFAYQKALERDARGGTRFREMLRSHYGVTIPDLVVQNAEYLGGSHSILNMDTVLQTSQTDTTPLGTTGAYSNTSIKDGGFTKSFVEPGLIMSLACVRPMQTYGQGIPRLLFKTNRFDFYYPVFSNIGEQPTYRKELFVNSENELRSDTPQVFGYNEAWVDYRHIDNKVNGFIRPDSGDNTMSSWTYANNFGSAPYLNGDFIKQNGSQIGRSLVDVNTSTQFVSDFYFDIKATREMPVFSIPGNIDRF